jgi:hypothetical protein
MSNRPKFIVAGIVILFILTGFFREFVFLNINEQMRVTYYNSPDPHVAPSMQWLSAFDYATLYYLKWPLTFLFAAVFASYSALVVRVLFREKQYVRVTWLAYAGVFTLSFVFFGIGLLAGSREVTYDIARFLAGMIETPAMLVILVSSFLILRRS